MSFLETFQLLAHDEEPDTFAEGLYNQICGEYEDDTPEIHVTFVLRFRDGGNSAVEKMSFLVPESQFTNVRVLADHYLSQYDVVHLLDDSAGDLMRAAVVVTDALASISVIGERVRVNDEDVRRGKFSPLTPDPQPDLGQYEPKVVPHRRPWVEPTDTTYQ